MTLHHVFDKPLIYKNILRERKFKIWVYQNRNHHMTWLQHTAPQVN